MASTVAWHPAIPSHDIRAGENIVGAMVQGQELALWRSTQGTAQAWENRCPHRGVRLTLGRLIDGRLSCGYHGWEYAADSGRCEWIPAMPDIPVPGKVCVRTYAVREAQGMVWVGLADGPAGHGADVRMETVVMPPRPAAHPAVVPPATPATFCQSLGIRASLPEAEQALVQHDFQQTSPAIWHGTLAQLPVLAFTLGADRDLSFIHLWCTTVPDGPRRSALFAAARRLRADIESTVFDRNESAAA